MTHPTGDALNAVPVSQPFPLCDILGVLTGRLLGKIDGVYALCGFMTGEAIFTHQLPRVCGELVPVILRQHPQLEPLPKEAEAVTGDNWAELLAGWVERYGTTLVLSPAKAGEHRSIDPLGDLIDMVGPDRVVVVVPE